jgi:hypothetical protein
MAAAIITTLLLAETILAPIQLQSYARSDNFTDTTSLKHAIRDSISVNLDHRDQHMDQENLCYRTNTCTGQNTLGNDNSVTGFTDQSDNLQESAATPTTPTTGNQTTGNQTGGNSTTPTPTPTPTPIPMPETATLTVIKNVTNSTASASQFTLHVAGTNPNPANFAGSETGVDVSLGAGDLW